MQGKSFVPALLCSIVSVAAFACSASNAPSRQSDPESTGSAEEAWGRDCNDSHTPLPVCRHVVLTADRTYGSHGAAHDGSASFSPELHFALPSVIPVTSGSPGKGTAVLTIKDDSRTVRCTYRGDAARKRYKLDGCDGCIDEDSVTADKLTLHLEKGDTSATTVARLELDENGHCQHGSPDAGAPDSGTPDSGHDAGAPDTGPACTPSQCDDGNPCTADACSASGCTHGPAVDGTACNDNNACTQTDVCRAGTCAGINPVSCAAGDACHVAGVCNPSTGQCTTPNAPDGTSCFSGDLCVFSDTQACKAGVCVGGFPDCGGAECASTACDSATGECGPSPAGTPCSGGSCDGDYTCVPSAPAKDVTYLSPICKPLVAECTSAAGVFRATSFGCEYAPLPAGTACGAGVCDGNNACVPVGTPPSTTPAPILMGALCPLPSDCLNAGSIDFAVGACAYIDRAVGTACAGGTCNGKGVCTP